MPAFRKSLFQRGADRGELRGEGGAHAVDRGDDRNSDAGGDQAVLDGGGAGLILDETRNEILHRQNSCVHVAGRTNVWSRRRSQHRDHGVTLRSENCGAVNSIAQTPLESGVLGQSKFGINTKFRTFCWINWIDTFAISG